jgi:hypothetical protein
MINDEYDIINDEYDDNDWNDMMNDEYMINDDEYIWIWWIW